MLEYQLPFVQALRMGPKMRRRMFEAIEQGHDPDFWRSTMGRGVYDDLLSAVRESGIPDAMNEFEDRFFPLLTAKQTSGQAVDPEEITSTDEATPAKDRRRGVWPGILALCSAAIVGALIIGTNAARMTAAERTEPKEATGTAATLPEGSTKPLPEPAQTTETELAAPDPTMTESSSEATSVPEPAISSEEKSSED